MSAIEAYYCTHGFPPTQREILRAIGSASKQTLDRAISRLQRAGRLSVERGCARSIIPLTETETFIRKLRIALREAEHDVPMEKIAKRSGLTVTVLKAVTSFLANQN